MSRLLEHDGCLFCDSQECRVSGPCQKCVERERSAREGPL